MVFFVEVFSLLGRNRNNTLDIDKLRVYVKPLIKAMTPPEARALIPILEQKITGDLFK